MSNSRKGNKNAQRKHSPKENLAKSIRQTGKKHCKKKINKEELCQES